MLVKSLARLLAIANLGAAAKKPNIVLILTDDQDYRLGSLDYQPSVQNHLVQEGTLFENHYVTCSICCPSRTSLLRGQAAHNTNITHVLAPGGAYLKFLAAGQDENYLPQWLGAAGYKTSYFGKLMNGIGINNYAAPPRGWDFVDVLLNPYTYTANRTVMSRNGERPVFYDGWHQSDVMRAKALARIDELTAGEDPWYLQIAPTAPHLEDVAIPPIPLQRHSNLFTNVTLPKPANFNPPDEIQNQKPNPVRGLQPLSQQEIDRMEMLYRARIQSAMGVDEIVEDVVEKLREKGELDNTYIIYSSDNGFHLGSHRLRTGKLMPYLEDTNVPLIVRGPGVPAGVVSKVASTHIDFAPTFLDIAGVPKKDQPALFDGRSLLDEWKNSGASCGGEKIDREIVNVEFWGGLIDELVGTTTPGNMYKTLRIVSDKQSWLYSSWCSGEKELYDTTTDPLEMYNIALSPTPEIQKTMDRLNALLMVTKSCAGPSCRNPWLFLAPQDSSLPPPNSLPEAMDPKYDVHFASSPQVTIRECMLYQFAENEVPFHPPEAQFGLGMAFRGPTDNYHLSILSNCTFAPVVASGDYGSQEQRHGTLAEMEESARVLTDAELLPDGNICHDVTHAFTWGG